MQLNYKEKGDRFDSPDNLFYSIQSMYNNIASHKSDLRELIHEFYYSPEMFLNANNINFHSNKSNKSNLGKWIDIIFGINQQNYKPRAG